MISGLEPGSTPPTKYQDDTKNKKYVRYKVWLSVLKFHASGLESIPMSMKEEKDCRTQLQIWDSNFRM